jgi:hypothetical protein
MLELGITIEENDAQEERSSSNTPEENSNNQIDTPLEEKKVEDSNEEENEIEDNDNEIESIESIPFMSEPAKKKSVRSKKISA